MKNDHIQDGMDDLFKEYTLEDVTEYIEIMKKTSGYLTSTDYWNAIKEGKEKGYSIVEVKTWERMEKLLRELEDSGKYS